MKKLLILVTIFSNQIFGQSQGPNSPATASYSVIGCLACPGAEWNNYNNIMAADGAYADISLNAFPNCFQTMCFYSRYLLASNFGFTIPANATIEGVKAEILRMSSTSPNVKDTIVQVFTQGNYGTNHASPVLWTPSLVNITYGDSIDIWGLVLTPDSVNDASFGFRIMIRNASPVVTFAPSSVDHIQMTVYYSISTGTFSQTRMAGELAIYPNPVSGELKIQNAKCKIERVEIYSAFGEKVFSKLVTSNPKQVTVDVSTLPPGIYFAVIDTGAEKIKQKFVRSNY